MERLETQDPMSRALAEIAAMESRLQVTGAADSERSEFELIRRQLINGRMTPDQASRAVRRIIEQRSEYH